MVSRGTRSLCLAFLSHAFMGVAVLLGMALPAWAQKADLILHHGKIITVDSKFRVAEAMAVAGDRILAVGATADVLQLAGPRTKQIDLAGKTVLPGLIDSHVHSTSAALYEYDHRVPDMQTIADVLQYIRSRAEKLEDGQWIRVSQVFITRLQDQRFPTRAELDTAAPNNPVVFRTGPDQALNSLALRLSGIDKDFKIRDGKPGLIERDSKTGEPTGVLRGAGRFVKAKSNQKSPSADDRADALETLLRDYNSVGITSISDRSASDSKIALYARLRREKRLPCRVYLYYSINAQAPLAEIRRRVEKAAANPLHARNHELWLRGVKVFLDGGMLTGSAYMRQPWGVSKIYSITDPNYRGTLYIEPERLYQISKLVLENNLQMTAHSVGDGAVHALISAYEEVNKTFPIRAHRPCITHCNFMSAEAVQKMKKLGIVADLQPAWLYLDGATLLKQFGNDRLAYFQPYKSLFDAGVVIGGGSDHMQKIGSLRAVNPYNPFLGMWTVLTRRPRGMDAPLHAEQSLTREQAIRLYTINNAYLSFEEDDKGSLEAGKLADFIVLQDDILSCSLPQLRNMQVLQTYVGGNLVFSRSN